jgi:hypothetical protein
MERDPNTPDTEPEQPAPAEPEPEQPEPEREPERVEHSSELGETPPDPNP